jgi:5-oxoprolinase (ATP-hydrolysing)
LNSKSFAAQSTRDTSTVGVTENRWQVFVDRGGTFTDLVARNPQGRLVTAKLLSQAPEQYDDAAVEGIRRLLDLPPGSAIPADRVEVVKVGTTVATNALLERKGEPTLLVITRGFGDALRIAYQNRPKLFEREIVLPELLYREVLEVDERINVAGEVLRALDLTSARRGMQAAYDQGLRAVAIVLMHADRYGEQHESPLAEIARSIGYTQVSVSHQVSPLVRLVGRGDTTVVDAYLTPVLRRYVDQLSRAMPGVRLSFMQSNGGLTAAGRFQGKDAVLSGPAGGIVGMARVSERAGFGRAIGFDMGGTSTDVSHYSGEFEREFETQVAGVRLRAPMLRIHTVAAGGGSILHFDGARFRVGPDSAGADPGPACYRRGGPLTLTDANVLLGRVLPEHFPAVFGPEANLPLDRDTVVAGFEEFAKDVSNATGRLHSAEEVAQGFIDIAVADMANAIKKISVQRGHDVTGYCLTVFGGAGGQFACAVADALGMTTVLAHPLAGVLSAYGMGLASQNAMREESIERVLDTDGLVAALATAQRLAAVARGDLEAQGEDPARITLVHRVQLRREGSDSTLTLDLEPSVNVLSQAFEIAYQKRFGFTPFKRALVIEAVSVEAISSPPVQDAVIEEEPRSAPETEPGTEPGTAPDNDAKTEPVDTECAFYVRDPHQTRGGKWQSARLRRRSQLGSGERVDGPAVVVEANATTVVDPGWRATMSPQRDLILNRIEPRVSKRVIGTEADPVMLEVFNNLFMSIAEQMGYRLQNTAQSVNIKERLDFSCALFDSAGHLIANAPHMPVHLGSMGASVEAVLEAIQANGVRAGDVWVLNDPYCGGTHLPDVTVVTPVFAEGGIAPLFWVASRGHHADIGGITPGSMPPDSMTIEDEGVLISPFLLVDGRSQPPRLREAEFLELLAAARYPARNPQQNLADLQAQVAANEKGREEILRMVEHWGLETVQAYMEHVQDNAAAAVARAIGALHDGQASVTMDDGAIIQVSVKVDAANATATIDFTGTSEQRPGNFNAPGAVTMAAVLYVYRCLVDDDIPMNAGCLRPLRVIIPQGSMLNPRPPAAVVAGNVEVSTCITNALFAALGVMAGAQPTMNNLTFGNARVQAYETISGGAGAGGRFDEAGRLIGGFSGASVVQTHMTNSRLTDPEVLELRFPVVLESYSIRRGSGGTGHWRGGDGGTRKIRFLEPMTVAILSNGRIYPAQGVAGGGDGEPGQTWIERRDGSLVHLGACDRTEVQAGDTVVIQTPGGGGFGLPVDPVNP